MRRLSEKEKTFERIDSEAGIVCAFFRCGGGVQETGDEALDVACFVDGGYAVFADDHGEGLEGCCADGVGLGGLEVETLEEEGEEGWEFGHDEGWGDGCEDSG